MKTLLSLLIIISFWSCTTAAPKKKKSISKTNKKRNDICEIEHQFVEQKYLTSATKAAAAKNIAHCFYDYIKFEKNKNQNLSVCNTLTVKKSGKVSFVYTRGHNGDRLPKDVKMCIEQEYWRMDFAKLQLDRGYTIRFPIEFKSN